MGIKLIKVFEEDLKKVQTDKMREVAVKILEKCDDLNASSPASSSGKYHPVADLGPGGLVRHSRMVAECVEIMIRSIPQYDDPIEHDIMFLAGLLHDMCKYTSGVPLDKKGNPHTNFKHPTMMAEVIKNVIMTDPTMQALDEPIKKAWARIGIAISSHMSRWNTSKYEEGELPLCTTQEQYILSFADLIAANANLPEKMFQFKEEAVKELTGRV